MQAGPKAKSGLNHRIDKRIGRLASSIIAQLNIVRAFVMGFAN